MTDAHPPPWTHAVHRTATGIRHQLLDSDGRTIYDGPDGDRVVIACQHAVAETGISPV
ncbi:hypothetical protein ABT341_23540 [Pseudonocardia alni]|uniref:hypothetical protein n=1 Tax=Pseudonocardia alni TaxID=33907 RepID=UPI0033230C60